MTSLFERLGGEGPLLAAVQGFYQRVLADPEVSRFFEGLSMDAQVQKQLSFMTYAFGGPQRYRGRELAEAHAPLVREHGLNDAHFDVVVGHLRDTLEELGFAPELCAEVVALVEGTRDAVFGRTTGAASE